MVEFVIIGAGVAGIAAANHLADLGAKLLVIEGGDYPAPKVCGEFLSPESLPLLHKWNVGPLRPVKHALFQTPKRTLHFPLSRPAACMPHMQRDQQLLDYALSKGVEVRMRTKVLHLEGRSDRYQLTLSTEEQVDAKHLLIATGRLPQFSKAPPVLRYVGLKTHVENVQLDDALEMYLFPGAYVGMVGIEENRANSVCLANRELVQGGSKRFVHALAEQCPRLGEHLAHDSLPWMQCQLPEFGVKQVPDLPNVYFLGDAAGSIPPITGDGVALALLSGKLAADFASRGDFLGYRKAWKKAFAPTIGWGLFLHRLMLRPRTANLLLRGCGVYSGLSDILYNLTRVK